MTLTIECPLSYLDWTQLINKENRENTLHDVTQMDYQNLVFFLSNQTSMPKPKQKATVLSCCCVLKSISKLIHLTSTDHLASLDYNWAKASGQKSWPGALTSLNMGTIRAVKEVDLGCLFTASPCTETSKSSVDEELCTPAPTFVCFSSTYTGGEI